MQESSSNKTGCEQIVFAAKQKRLSLVKVTLSFAPYAEGYFSQQNKKSGSETIQNHGPRESFTRPIRAASFALGKERKA